MTHLIHTLTALAIVAVVWTVGIVLGCLGMDVVGWVFDTEYG